MATLLAAAVILPLLGHRTLAMWDEGIYAEISREMLRRGLLVPLWNYHPWFEKPPLMLWITAGFFHLFGISEFWARAGSAFSGVATVALAHHWLARRQSLLAAWISSVVLLSTFGYLHVCRAGEMDALLALSELIAALGLVRIHELDRRGWYIFWLGFAFAVMTKGAASVVLPVTLIVVALVESWRWPRFGMQFFAGLGMFLAVVLPWHVAMFHRYGVDFLHQYFGFHVLARASMQIEGHHTRAWYYLVVLLVSAPPWVLLYPSSVAEAFRQQELRAFRILAIFALTVLVVFTIAQTRLPHYIAPLYPVCSILVAVFMDRWLRARNFAQRSTLARSGLAAAALAAWGVAALLTSHARSQLHSPRMANGIVTPDTHEPAALLKQVFGRPQPESGPLLLWSEPPIAPVTTALFYARRPVLQVIVTQPQPEPADSEYTWEPIPLNAALCSEPRLAVVEKPLLAQLPSSFVFTPIRSSAHWEVGTLARRRPK